MKQIVESTEHLRLMLTVWDYERLDFFSFNFPQTEYSPWYLTAGTPISQSSSSLTGFSRVIWWMLAVLSGLLYLLKSVRPQMFKRDLLEFHHGFVAQSSAETPLLLTQIVRATCKFCSGETTRETTPEKFSPVCMNVFNYEKYERICLYTIKHLLSEWSLV